MKISRNMVRDASEQVMELVKKSVLTAIGKGLLPKAELPEFIVEIPGDASHGDFASNVALASARAFKTSPVKIARIIVENFDFAGSMFIKAESAGPGFINFFLDPSWFARTVKSILTLDNEYGRTDYGKSEKVMVEFVSANPTGPMTLGNARGGALGDCLASVLDAAGYNVEREFYVNDAGSQIEKFGISLEARYLQLYKGDEAVGFPEDGYHGDDIRERVKEYADEFGDKLLNAEAAERRQALIDYALPKNIAALRETLLNYRVEYDTWFHESSLHANGAVSRLIELLRVKGLTYEKDGALWYKATDFGADKDEVLVRGNGHPTYFASDMAYHYNKFAIRGFSTVINLLGADHHGHVVRFKGAMEAMGLPGDKLEIVLFQFVNLLMDGKPYKMSKRTGRSITLADLIEEVPVDAARFFFNMRDTGSVIDFDMDLAAEQSSQNPVYYVQYAHARICSIFVKLEDNGVKADDFTLENLVLLKTPEEIELIRHLARYPGEIILAAQRRDPVGLTHYVSEAAALFHKFYNAQRVMVEDESLMRARLALCAAVRIVIRNALGLMKISAPERM